MPSGTKSGMYIPCLMAILLLLREVYSIVIISLQEPQLKAVWYSLMALPELLVVFLFAVPGLIPRKEDLVPHPQVYGKGEVIDPV